MIILPFCAYFLSQIFTANGVEPNSNCDCTNPVYIDQPTNIVQCFFKSKFYHQVNANFAITNGFLDLKSAKDCNYTEYRNIVNQLKKSILQIVDSYFNCKKGDCIPAIMAAYKKYREIHSTKLIPYMVCSYINLPPECAVNIKYATFFSAENIMTTLIACSNLKASCQRPDYKLLFLEFCSKKTPDCNCVKIDPRPIPTSEEQCYSAEYSTTVKDFITVNFGRVKEVYQNASIANPQCNYSKFIELTNKLENVAIQWPNILQESYPKFEQIKSFTGTLLKVALELSEAIRMYVIKMEKNCYFTPRKLRQAGSTIMSYVLRILTKCVMYKDAANSIC